MFGAALAGAAPRVVVLADDTPTGREVSGTLVGELHRAGFSEVATESLPVGQKALSVELRAGSGDIVVAAGPQALAQALERLPGRPVVALMLTRASFEELVGEASPQMRRDVYGVVLDQPLVRYLDLIALALPQRQRIGLLFSEANAGQVKSLDRLAAERGLVVRSIAIAGDATFIQRLDRLLGESDLLLALPDAGVHNRNTVQPLLLTTYRAGVPVVAYSEAYRKAGALVSLYSTPAQLARQAAGIASDISQRKPVARVQFPQDFSVGVNDTVARSLGLAVPAGEILRERLRPMAE